LPVGHLTIGLDQLTPDDSYQLTLFDNRPKLYAMERTIDQIKDRYGSDAILRASSLFEAGVARERAEQIGGHFK
jgi:DNA polymerase-4